MHLARRTFLLAAAVSIVACNADPAAPPGFPASYSLDNISGRPLPTFFSPIRIPEAPLILSASLSLDGSGNATLVQREQPMTGGEVVLTSTYTYVISGNEIQFDYSPPCPPNALCVAPPKGTITGSRLSLEFGGPTSGVVYEFRLFALD